MSDNDTSELISKIISVLGEYQQGKSRQGGYYGKTRNTVTSLRKDITFLEEIRHKIKVGATAKADKMCEHWIEELDDMLYGAKIAEKEQGAGYTLPIDIPMYMVSSHIRQGIDWYDKYVNKQNQAIQPRDPTNRDNKGE